MGWMGGAGEGLQIRSLPCLWAGLPRTETEETTRNRRLWEERRRPTLSRAVPSPQYGLSVWEGEEEPQCLCWGPWET